MYIKLYLYNIYLYTNIIYNMIYIIIYKLYEYYIIYIKLYDI